MIPLQFGLHAMEWAVMHSCIDGCVHACAAVQVINMEWGNFWSPNLPLTTYDEALDDKSHNCGEQVSQRGG